MKRYICIFILFTFVITTAAAVFPAEQQYIKISKPGESVRKNPWSTAKVIAQAKVGSTFRVITLKYNYFEILMPSGQKGYVLVDVANIITQKELQDLKTHRLVSDPKAAERAGEYTGANYQKETDWAKDKYVQITENRTALRSNPSENSSILKTARKGDVLKIISCSNNWYEILLPSAQKAYVDSRRVIVVIGNGNPGTPY